MSWGRGEDSAEPTYRRAQSREIFRAVQFFGRSGTFAMTPSIRELFEAELRRRGLSFTIDEATGRHVIQAADWRLLVSLDNLQKEVRKDYDIKRVSRFVDAIIATSTPLDIALSSERLFWCLDRNDYTESADYRIAISDCVDRVLVEPSHDARLIRWVSSDMLHGLAMSEHDAGAKAFSNLARALTEATLESHDIDGVPLGYLATSLPFKASLMLAPNLKEVIGARLGWPLMAVAPDRNFLYLWAACHADFVQRVGHVVVDEHERAAYPISTEVFEINDDGIRAIGEFPCRAR
jgi:hypothetical protein